MSCFYREVPTGPRETEGDFKSIVLTYKENEKTFDPVQVYGDAPNPTKL